MKYKSFQKKPKKRTYDAFLQIFIQVRSNVTDFTIIL